MEEEVLTRYKVKKEAMCEYMGRSKPLRRVYQKVRLKALEGRECLARLRKFSDVCKSSVFEGMNLAKDVGRMKHPLQLLIKVHKLASSGHNGQKCQQAFEIMKEGTADGMEQYITKMTQEARQPRLEDGSVCHKTSVEKLCVSAESSPWRGSASRVRSPEEDAEQMAGVKFEKTGMPKAKVAERVAE